MNIILKSKLSIVVFLVMFCLKVEAQFLDKTYYLVDSIESATIGEEDRAYLDEQIKLYRVAKSDTLKIELISNIVENIQEEKVWVKYNHLLYNFSKNKLKTISNTNERAYFVYKSAEALALNNFGYYYFNYTSRYDLAYKYYYQGLEINESIKNYDELVTSYSNIGNVYQNRGDLNNALLYFQKALALENTISDKLSLLAPLNNIAQVYFHLNDTIKALNTLKRALKISYKSENNFLKASLLHNIGSLTYFRGDKTGAQTLKKALAFRQQIGDKKGTLQTTLSLAGIENNNQNYSMCKTYLDDAAKLVVLFPNSNIEAHYHYQLGNYYTSINKTNLAIDNLEKSISIYKRNLENDDMHKALVALISLYSLNNEKYALKKLEAYELQQKILKNIDKGKAQKLLLKQKYDDDLKINEAKFKFEQQLTEEKNKSEKRRQQFILVIVCVILLVVIVFSVFIYRALKLNKQKSKIISAQKIEVEHQKNLIEEKHKDITDSITYAHRIQSSLIPTQKEINKLYPLLSVLFQPRDIVSGDFYWYSKIGSLNIFALADCTGHGVPGAFMSIIGINHLNTLVNEKKIINPAHILDHLKTEVVKSLNSNTTSEAEKKDGMDVALICFDDKLLTFSGANQSVLIIRNHELTELKGDKQPVGLSDSNTNFTQVVFDIIKGDRIVLYSDGVVDQFGGEAGKKLKSRHFKSWLVETSYVDVQEQKNILTEKLNTYKGIHEQTDDITFVIIEI